MSKPPPSAKRRNQAPPSAKEMKALEAKQAHSRKRHEERELKEKRDDFQEVSRYADEWVRNDYADEEDLEKLGEKIIRAAEFMEAEGNEGLRLISEETERIDAEREARRAERRAKVMSEKGLSLDRPPASFDDVVREKVSELSLDPVILTSIDKARQGADATQANSPAPAPEARPVGPNPTPNRIIIADPDEVVRSDEMGTKMPRPLDPSGNPLFLPDSPGALLSTQKLLESAAVLNLETFLNRFRIGGSEKLYYPGDIEAEFADPILGAFAKDQYQSLVLDRGIFFVHYIANPLFVVSVFERREDKEGRKAATKPMYRVYSWKGHAYTEAIKEEEVPLPSPSLPAKPAAGGYE
jgi:hypothetical protein